MIAIYLNTVREWGGVDVLATRFATFLRNVGEPFYIIEREGGRIRSDLPWAKFHSPSSLSSAPEPEHVLVTSLPKLVHGEFPWPFFRESKMLTWAVHPLDPFRKFFPYSGKLLDYVGFEAVRPLQWCFRSHTRLVRDFFEKIIHGDGLCAMDGANLRALGYFYPNIASSVPIVPVPSPLPDLIAPRKPHGTLAASYFGRLDSFKWSALGSFVEGSLGPMARTRPVELHCIGDGPCMSNLMEACGRFGIQLFQHGFLANAEARKCVAAQSMFSVAMGTAALDVAGQGHPCLIIDPALGPFPKDQRKYRFVDETSDFTLGEYRDAPGYVAGLRTFDECIEPRMLVEHGEASRAYVGSLHAPDKCFVELLEMLRSSRICGRDLTVSAHKIMAAFNGYGPRLEGP